VVISPEAWLYRAASSTFTEETTAGYSIAPIGAILNFRYWIAEHWTVFQHRGAGL
jgi:hypothetical protein